MKDMRSPCVPRIQSSALVHGSKLPRRVREQEREDKRDAGIGEKRVSSNALL